MSILLIKTDYYFCRLSIFPPWTCHIKSLLWFDAHENLFRLILMLLVVFGNTACVPCFCSSSHEAVILCSIRGRQSFLHTLSWSLTSMFPSGTGMCTWVQTLSVLQRYTHHTLSPWNRPTSQKTRQVFNSLNVSALSAIFSINGT